MKNKLIGVIGGAGFVGSSIVAKLDLAGYQVKVLTRHRERAKHLILLPNVQVVSCNVHDDIALAEGLKGCDAVINLVGILHESKRTTFDLIHHQLPERIAKVCHQLGIKRLLHMSALQADENAPSQYLRSKARGEAALNRFKQSMNITIFRPSVIFGREDQFLNLFAKLIQYLPIILLAKPSAKFQPIWVEDVANIFVNSLQNDATFGNGYDLVGPTIYSLQDLVVKVMHALNKRRLIIGLGDRLSYLQAWMMEWLPIKLMSRDNVRSMAIDSIAEGPMANEILLPLTSLDAVIPTYIQNKTPRAAYDQYRAAAGRVINARR
jgi:NADH dehydrogenase